MRLTESGHRHLGSSYVFTREELGSLITCPGTPVTAFIDAGQ
jgi:hypothetical protein